MKHIIILGDGMADKPVERLGGLTLLQRAETPAMDRLATKGRSGLLSTIPQGFEPGSEVANTAILGYDLNEVYEGRGPLEAASIGYEMKPEDMAMRCNIITLEAGCILNHHGGHLSTADGAMLIEYLNDKLGNDKIRFIAGIQYRHLLVIEGGSKYIECAPPHDNPGRQWQPLLVKPMKDAPVEPGRMTAEETAELINDLILKSQQLLTEHPFNIARRGAGKPTANSIWPWSGGYRPRMKTLQQRYPEISTGSVLSAVDLIRGIGHYAGLRSIVVEGATGLADTNYEGKAEAAIEALKNEDFLFLHVEATDEAGHDGDLDLKLKAIEYLDSRIVAKILDYVESTDEDVAVALLPDHATPVESRVHEGMPVPFTIWHRNITPDAVRAYSEVDCAKGSLGMLHLDEFMQQFMSLK